MASKKGSLNDCAGFSSTHKSLLDTEAKALSLHSLTQRHLVLTLVFALFLFFFFLILFFSLSLQLIPHFSLTLSLFISFFLSLQFTLPSPHFPPAPSHVLATSHAIKGGCGRMGNRSRTDAVFSVR